MHSSVTSGNRFSYTLAAGAAGGFLALAVVVAIGVSRGWDLAMRDWGRPGDEWGTAQVRADYVVEALRPQVCATLLAVFTVVVSWRRRSARLAIFVGAASLLIAVVTAGLKMVFARPDPHGLAAPFSGSFPSGHTVTVIAGSGLALFLITAHPRRGAWLLPVLGGTVMGTSLVIEGAHWATDVVSAALLATALLATVSATGCVRWAHRETT